MDSDFLNVFTQPAALNQFLDEVVVAQGEKKKIIKPTSSNNPKLEELKSVLIDWINTSLKEEHIVVRSLEEDLYDGLVLHHLLENLGSLKLDVDKIALTEKKQRQKLSVILEAVAKCLQLEESQLKWSVESILTKDLLSTLHLLVAIAKHFQPNLAMPPNVQVETIIIESTLGLQNNIKYPTAWDIIAKISTTALQGCKSMVLGAQDMNTSRGLKTVNAVEYITENKENLEAQSKDDAFDELFSRAPDKLDAVKQVFLDFVNQHVGKLGLNVKDIESQFADGVILLLLIGQLEGYFLNLRDFFLTPASSTEMPCSSLTDIFQEISYLYILDTNQSSHFLVLTLDTLVTSLGEVYNGVLYWFSTILYILLHNVNLALDLLTDGGLLNFSVNSEDIVNGDTKTTMRVLYCLYSKYKTKET